MNNTRRQVSFKCGLFVVCALFTGSVYAANGVSPSFRVQAAPTIGTQPTLFQLSAGGLTDDTTPVEQLGIRWDFDGDGAWDTEYAAATAVLHQYADTGMYRIRAEVRDADGHTGLDSILVGVFSGPVAAGPLNAQAVVAVPHVSTLALSGNGNRLYAGGFGFGGLSVFERSVQTGQLTQHSLLLNSTAGATDLQDVVSIAVSPDGRHVYAAAYSQHAIIILTHNPDLGLLTVTDIIRNLEAGVTGLSGVSAVRMTADGRHLYATGLTSNSLVVFSRNDTTGALTLVEEHRNYSKNVLGLGNAIALRLSPDERQLYVASTGDNAIAVFQRNPDTGMLQYLTFYKDGVDGVDGLLQVESLDITPDGKFLYATGIRDNAVAAFARNTSTGLLTFRQAVRTSLQGGGALQGVRWCSVSPDGRRLYTASDVTNTVAVFDRDTVTGVLTPVHELRQGINAVGLSGAYALTVAPGGGHVYVAGHAAHAIAVLSTDGGVVNTPPVARLVSSHSTGTTDTVFTFDPLTTTDAEESYLGLAVRWDWESDGQWDTGYTYINPLAHRYHVPGRYTATVEVRDRGLLLAHAVQEVLVYATTTIRTEPSGLTLMIDGAMYAAPVTFNGWETGSTHTLQASDVQEPSPGVRKRNPVWSDGTAVPGTFVIPAADTAFVVRYTETQFFLETAVSPPGSGVIQPESPGIWVDSGLVQPVSAVLPQAGYMFAGFGGDVVGLNNPQGVPMHSPRVVTAYFGKTMPGGGWQVHAPSGASMAIQLTSATVVWINGEAAGQGDLVSVWSAETGAYGGVIDWQGSTVTLAVWPDDPGTGNLSEGPGTGEFLRFAVYDVSTGDSLYAYPVFREGVGVFSPDAVLLLDSLIVLPDSLAPPAPSGFRGVDTPNDLGGSVTLTITPPAAGGIPPVMQYHVYMAPVEDKQQAVRIATVAVDTLSSLADGRIQAVIPVSPAVHQAWFWIQSVAGRHVSPVVGAERVNILNNSLAVWGDFNGNGEVDILDISYIASIFGRPESYDPALDLNHNGEIDIWDVAILAVNFGKPVH